MNRRAAVSGLGVALSVGFAGCLSADPLSSGSADGFDPDVDPSTRLGSAERASIEAEPEREYEYLADDDAVRITYDGGRTNRMSFDEWGTRRAAAAAESHVRSVIDEAGLTDAGIGVASGVTELDDLAGEADESAFDRAVPLGPIVLHTTVYSRDGERVSSPGVEFDPVVAAAPSAVDVTMPFDERDYTAVVPVLCRREWMQED